MSLFDFSRDPRIFAGMARKPRKARKPASRSGSNGDRPPRNPTTSAASGGSLNAQALAELLTKAGLGEIAAATIDKDLAAGAPQNADGTINPFHYAAWLAREAGGGDGSGVRAPVPTGGGSHAA